MPRTRDLERQRDELSAAVWGVIADHGLAGLTVRAVAERAGRTTGLVFHTFPTKRDLLVHARRLLLARAAARVDDIEAANPDPVEALRAVALALLTLGRDGGDEARVWVGFVAASLSEPELARHHLDGNRALLARLERLITAAHPHLDPESARDVAAHLAALVEGFNTVSLLDPEGYPRRRQERIVLATLAGLARP